MKALKRDWTHWKMQGAIASAIDNIRDKNGYGIEITANLSLTYNIDKNASLRVICSQYSGSRG